MPDKDFFFAAEELDLRWIDGHNWRVLTHLFQYPYGTHEVVVPFGFITDFASVPQVLWNILPPVGSYGKAAVLHDFLYRTGTWSIGGPACSRSDADSVLRAAMVDCNVGAFSRWSIYSGVRAGGWVQWNSYRNGPPYTPPPPEGTP